MALRLGIDEAELAESLARARKELRRTLAALPGSGWCERAERPDLRPHRRRAAPSATTPRLDVHLRNCPRCVEHERRLVQATDALVAGVAPAPEPRRAIVPASRAAAPSWPRSSRPRDAEPRAAAGRARALASWRGAVGWNVLLVLAIVLALASLALVLAGALGAQF